MNKHEGEWPSLSLPFTGSGSPFEESQHNRCSQTRGGFSLHGIAGPSSKRKHIRIDNQKGSYFYW